MNNRYGAYIAPELAVSKLGHGTLDGLIFAVKDVFAVAGHSSSAGNPDWLRSHEPSSNHATAVRKLLLSGASLKGATHTDELMYSLGGENYHYGTPVNPRALDRIPGGSSSGSAVAVAAGSVDFALGTDTGGSTRVPSAYCGVYGFRPTHGVVAMDGVIPLAPSFDTVGWIADSVNVLQKVGTVLLGSEEKRKSTMAKVYVATDCWALAEQESARGLMESLRQLQAGADSTSEMEIATEGLRSWMDIFRELQGDEIWATHGAWIEKMKPTFGPDIAARFAWAGSLSGKDHSLAQTIRQTISARLRLLLGEENCLVIPTVPGPAPLLGGDLQQLEQNRSGAMMLSCIAGLADLPQITLPVISDCGLPLGLSVIGGHGQDLRLLSWVNNIWQ
ncbi:amidase [Paenibacillus monticola]|uniref:Amidase n=1 Tax=Paenibacillus monticola TaxID=2666075 RepID=A0A7X2L170_9BACL|nr:amidase [Paenibacillus monticola]MRN52026.1 amidase [Paenibacillus monticola]